MKSSYRLPIIICTAVVLLIVSIFIHRKIEAEKLNAEYDAALESYRKNVISVLSEYRDANGYISYVNVDPDFYIGSVVGNYGTQFTYVDVEPHMTDEFNKLSYLQKSRIVYRCDEEIRKICNEVKAESDYESLIKEKGRGSYSPHIKVRGMWLSDCGRPSVHFRGDDLYYFYEGEFYVGGCGYEVTWDPTRTWITYVTAPWDKKESKASTNKQSSSVTTGSASKSGKTKKSDIYDVYDYESAQDFADDKYEEFYDYEDDYEDEDEAYDAAEDYWNDHH